MRLVQLAERLSSATAPVCNSTLAAELGVSIRTIQNDLKLLRSASAQHGFLLQTKRGLGSVIRVNNTDHFQEYLQRLRMASGVNSSELPQLILQNLVIAKDYVSAGDLGELLRVGRSAIIAALDSAELLARQEGFSMDRRPHLGVRIKGTFATTVQFLSFRYISNDHFMHHFVKLNLPLGFSKIVCELRRKLSATKIYVSYPEFNNLLSVLKILMCLEVIGLNTKFNDDSNEYQRRGSVNNEIVLELVSAILETTGIELKSIAVIYLDEVLSTLTDRVQLDELGEYELKGQIAHVISDFLTKWDESHATTYMKDNSFRTMLLNHLVLLISRSSRNDVYQSEFGEELTITNPSNVDLALLICQRLQECFGVNITNSEVSLVAAHLAAHNERERQNRLRDFARVAVVGTTGAGGAYLAKLQFEQIFPVADIHTFSYLDIDSIKSFAPDLVLSMIPLDSSIKTPVIKISEVLSQGEISNINEIISYGELKDGEISADQIKIPFRTNLFKRINPSINKSRYTTIVSQLARELEEHALAQLGFKDLVLEREKYASTVYLNGVCIPHPLEPVGNEDVVSVCVVDHGLTHYGRDVRLIFLVCLRTEHVGMYKPIARRLYTLMRNRQLVEQLVSSMDAREFIHAVEQMEATYED